MTTRWRTVTFRTTGNLPATGLTLDVTLVDREGGARPVPLLVTEIGLGAYGFEFSVEDELVGSLALIDGGPGLMNRHQLAYCSNDGLIALLFLNANGSLYSGGNVASVAAFVDKEGNPFPALTLTQLINPIYVATVPPEAMLEGGYLDIVGPADAIPRGYTSTIGSSGSGGGGTPPVVSNITPAPGTPINPYQPVQLDVTDAEGLGTVRLYVFFEDGSRDLVYHPKWGFSPKYAPGSSRVTIPNGARFRVVPASSWPVRTTPSLVVDASDPALENA